MFSKIFSPDLTTREQLRQLFGLRQFYLVLEVTTVGMSQWLVAIELPWLSIWLVVAFHVLLTLGYYGYSLVAKSLPDHLLVQTILLDILAFTGLLYFSGGATNGIVSILLLPVATAAALFRWHFALALALVAISCYSLLMFNYYPLVGAGDHVGHLSSHLVAMWITFIFSCLLMVWFIGLQADAVREKNKKLARLRGSQLRDEQLIAIATFAANAAHDLATPLSSVALLCDEIKSDDYLNLTHKEGLDTLIAQVNRCRDIVQSISHQSMLNHSRSHQDRPVAAYFKQLFDRWLVTRADLELQWLTPTVAADWQFCPDAGLETAIINIINNSAAATVANQQRLLTVALHVNEASHEFTVTIADQGAGIEQQLLSQLGKNPVNSKQDGLGLGQFLANAIIERNGGQVWRESDEKGTKTHISLPLIQ